MRSPTPEDTSEDNGEDSSINDEQGRVSSLSDEESSERFRSYSERERSYDPDDLRPDVNGQFSPSETSGRGAAPVSRYERQDRGLSSVVGSENRDGYGQTLSSSQRQRAARIRRWQQRVQVSGTTARSQRQGLDEIQRMATALGIKKDVRQMACRLFRQSVDADLLPGRAIESVASASLYIAARSVGYPRSFDEIAAVSRVKRKRIINGYEAVRDEFGLSLAPVDPQSYLPRVASEAGVSQSVQQRAAEIIQTAQERDGGTSSVIGGMKPTSVVASALFAAKSLEGDCVTQTEIADAANVHESTIRNNYRRILEPYHELNTDKDT